MSVSSSSYQGSPSSSPRVSVGLGSSSTRALAVVTNKWYREQRRAEQDVTRSLTLLKQRKISCILKVSLFIILFFYMTDWKAVCKSVQLLKICILLFPKAPKKSLTEEGRKNEYLILWCTTETQLLPLSRILQPPNAINDATTNDVVEVWIETNGNMN